MYIVTIKYVGVAQDISEISMPICRLFQPAGSYIDSAAYAGTKFASNVEGWGSHLDVEPYASTSIPLPVPLAKFKLAVVGKDNMCVFKVEDYKEAVYYAQLGAAMADQGFVITIEDAGAAGAGAGDPIGS